MMNWLQSIFTSALFKGSKTRVLCVLTLLALVVVLSAAALPNATLSSPQTNVTYYACVNNTSGAITIVSKSTKCPTGSQKIHWNQQGPIGPQGPQGVQGVQGIQGIQGPQGPAGVSQGYFSSKGNVNISTNNGQLVPVVSTIPLAASGTYIVTASEVAIVASGDTVARIITSAGGAVGSYFSTVGPVSNLQYTTITVTDSVSVGAGDQLQLSCVGYNGNPSTISYSAGISAIQLNSVQSNINHNNPRPQLPKPLSHK